MNVILSIRPNFCKMIFCGQMVYEYRKRIFTCSDVDKVYVYATKPICKIEGYFTIDEVIADKKNDIWEKKHKDGGISKEFFDAYFKNSDTAYAIKIGQVVKLDNQIDPKSVIKNFNAPQNFMYVDFDL